MENKLENICSEKVRIMRKAYLTKSEENCRFNCLGYDKSCEFYIPVKVTELCIRQGQMAYELMRS